MRFSFLLLPALALFLGACGDDSNGSGGQGAAGPGSTNATGTGGGAQAGVGGAGGGSTNCTPGEMIACYDGPEGTSGIGACIAGSQQCLADGISYGPCQGQVLPQLEDCATAADESCDGADCGQTLFALGMGPAVLGQLGAAVAAVDWNGTLTVAAGLGGPLPFAGSGYMKIDASGAIVETRVLSTATNALEFRLGVDGLGQLAFAARGGDLDFGTGALNGLMVAKLGSDGMPAFAVSFPAGIDDHLSDMVVAANGDIVLVGYTLDTIDFGNGPLAAGAWLARLSGIDGSTLGAVSLGPVGQAPRVAELSGGKLAVSNAPTLELRQSDLSADCAFVGTFDGFPSLAAGPAGDVWLARRVGMNLELSSLATGCVQGSPVTIATTGPTNPRVVVDASGGFFLAWRINGSQILTRRAPDGSEIWSNTYPASNLVDSSLALYGGISPIVLGLNTTGAGIDYGTGLLPNGAVLARIAP